MATVYAKQGAEKKLARAQIHSNKHKLLTNGYESMIEVQFAEL